MAKRACPPPQKKKKKNVATGCAENVAFKRTLAEVLKLSRKSQGFKTKADGVMGVQKSKGLEQSPSLQQNGCSGDNSMVLENCNGLREQTGLQKTGRQRFQANQSNK